jgi:hypothetical protein
VSWQVVFAKHALKDAPKLSAAGLKPKAQVLSSERTVRVLRMWTHDD